MLKEDRDTMKRLQDLPNVGPACAADLMLLGITSVEQLKSRTADDLYSELCAKTAARQDPCVWDTFASVVHFANTGERKKWWDFTTVRKAGGATVLPL